MTGLRGRRCAPLSAVLAAVALAVAAGCGVEVPDDVAEEVREEATTTSTTPATTEPPTSDDELEQALIDNGYTAEEAACGAENLRAELPDDEIATIVEADTIEDISPTTARAFASALQPCVSAGGGAVEDDDDDGGGSGIGSIPDFGDDSEGDVSRSRFLSSLISAGIDDEVARCIVDRVFAELDQDDINTVFHAETEADVPEDVLDVLAEIDAACT